MKQGSVFSMQGLKVFAAFFFVGSAALAASPREASLHIPWTILESKFQNFLGAPGQSWNTSIPDFTLPVGGVDWRISGVNASLSATQNVTTFNGKRLDLKAGPMSGQISVASVSADQIVDVNLGGAVLHAHIQMACGPIVLSQSNASVAASASFDWTSGDPSARVDSFALSWAPGSWSVADFACSVGPADLTATLKAQLRTQLADPSIVQPYLNAWLASSVNSRLQDALSSLRQPLSVPAGAAGNVTMQVGRLQALNSGLLADLSVGVASSSGVASSHAWSSADLSALPLDRPALIAPVASVQGLLNDTIALQPSWISIDLLKVDAFKSLLSSRFMQFFVWVDLWNYTPTSPFVLQVQRPAALVFDSVSSSGVTTSLDLMSVLRSKRDGKWWNYVEVWGKSKASIALSVSAGSLSYATSLTGTSLQASFTQEYVDQYGMPGNLPVSTLASSLSGNQSALSGSLKLPDVDFGVGGKFRASGLVWKDGKTVVIPWAPVAP